jgi:hypothetical protein
MGRATPALRAHWLVLPLTSIILFSSSQDHERKARNNFGAMSPSCRCSILKGNPPFIIAGKNLIHQPKTDLLCENEFYPDTNGSKFKVQSQPETLDLEP